MLRSRLSAAVAAVALLATSSVQATNGYFTHGVGTKNKSLAGAGTAAPGEAIATANNPASAALVGSRFEMGGGIFSPRRNYESSPSLAMGNGGAVPSPPSGRENFSIVII